MAVFSFMEEIGRGPENFSLISAGSAPEGLAPFKTEKGRREGSAPRWPVCCHAGAG